LEEKMPENMWNRLVPPIPTKDTPTVYQVLKSIKVTISGQTVIIRNVGKEKIEVKLEPPTTGRKIKNPICPSQRRKITIPNIPQTQILWRKIG
jgi:hypothetical protein